ncbi:alanyl-tRNA editing protein [Methylovirgula sp. 4M-Z18]|uniref:alanyl-tRNA editing protein n=1 Tax=Methylovirgula sp. 4M-Z18 TaxID=2293567 RepID=UPI000E2EF16A|nr:alanyl-tRNA editing protein [Methylovirgula sp. 4M-Z18]RFB80937.1 alanyl-tRNA editing protein [Methylovirgula sp. 4M-Z18]
MTELLFRADAYLKQAEAQVLAVNERGGIVLNRTIFYAQGGGQPGDKGMLRRSDGREIAIATTVYDADKTTVVHVPAEGQDLPAPGEAVALLLDWPVRYSRMRAHTALHLLSVALPYPVTGGAIGDGDGRLDFDIPEAGLDKAEIEAKLKAMVASNAEVRQSWITDDELLANPGLVKTMSVKPPMGTGRVRLIEIVGLDLQPCGGTHVGTLGEIGAIEVTSIEKKGKQNRRVRIALR